MPTNESQNFESAFAELQKIIVKLENSELSLDEAIRLYEEGKRLSTTCAGILENAQLRLTQISESESAAVELEQDDELDF